MTDEEIIAREIWTYNECPWDFDNPPEGMARLQKQIALDQAAAILTALRDNGRVIVPREPTQAMLDDVTAADQHEPFSYKTIADIYRAMIAAGEKDDG